MSNFEDYVQSTGKFRKVYGNFFIRKISVNGGDDSKTAKDRNFRW